MSLGRPRLLIIGNGMACNRLLTRLQEQGGEHFRITVIGQEREPAYNRVLLTPWLNGEISTDELRLQTSDWYERNQIQLHLGDAVVSLDVLARQARCASGSVFTWDLLVLATGSQALMPPLPGSDLNGVMCLRTREDAQQLLNSSHASITGQRRVVVLGGGVLGLEAACALHDQGMKVCVVHRDRWLMNRQLDEEAGQHLGEAIRARGIEVYTGMQCNRFLASDQNAERLGRVELIAHEHEHEHEHRNGHAHGHAHGHGEPDSQTEPVTLDADTVVVAIGIKPETSLAADAGLRCAQGIQVDKWMRSSVEGVFALGECCQIDQQLFGLVAPVYQQADVLAELLTRGQWQRRQPATKGYEPQTLATRLKVAGLDVCSVGMPPSVIAGGWRSLVWRDPRNAHYRRLWLQQGRLRAAIGLGDIDGLNTLGNLIDEQWVPADPAALLLGHEGHDPAVNSDREMAA